MNRILRKPITFLFCAVCIISYAQAQDHPLSDPTNAQNWILNEYLSDEFNLDTLDKTKWWVLGENGDYRSKWKGRAPGQFAPHNVNVRDGDLIITSQWEPGFSFSDESFDGTPYGGVNKSHPITQGGIISERFFKYGYMEIRCKIADAPVTSAFWTTGYHSEIDMIENYGKRPISNPQGTPEVLEKKYRTNMINWDPERTNTEEWKTEKVLNVRGASDYYVYGFEWDKDYVKIYFNGVLIKSATRQELEAKDQWRHFYPQEIWLDSEVFSWYGLPTMADLTDDAEFKIDYVRIWQKEITGPNFNALGFEGPFYFQGRSNNWFSFNNSPWRMKNDKVATGDLSLRFKTTGTFTGSSAIYSPYGSLNLPAGNNEIKMKIWIDPTTTVSKLRVNLKNPFKAIDIDLSGVEKGKWVEVSQTFNRNQASNLSIENGDRLEIEAQSSDVSTSGAEALFYIDDISFQHMVVTAFEGFKSDTEFTIYPNPTTGIVHLSKETVWGVYSTMGTKLLEGEGSLIDLSIQESGVYLIKIDNQVFRIAKQ